MNSFLISKAKREIKLLLLHIASALLLFYLLDGCGIKRLAALLPLSGAASALGKLSKIVRGSYAEELVERELRQIKGAEVIRNLRFKYGDIDFVVISGGGIFPIEVKSIRGKLKIEKGKALYGRKNLLEQVFKAENFLKEILPEYVDHIRGYLVVEGGRIEGRHTRVLRRYMLGKVLKGKKLKEEEITEILERLRSI